MCVWNESDYGNLWQFEGICVLVRIVAVPAASSLFRPMEALKLCEAGLCRWCEVLLLAGWVCNMHKLQHYLFGMKGAVIVVCKSGAW